QGIPAAETAATTAVAASLCRGVSSGERTGHLLHPPLTRSSPTRTFCVNNRKIDMSTITEIQEAIEKLPSSEKSVLAAWLQSKEEPIMSEAEEAALLTRLDKAA